MNFRGYSLTDPSDLDHLEALVVQHCEGPGKVDCIVWYDGFNIDPALESHTRIPSQVLRSGTTAQLCVLPGAHPTLRFGAELAKRDLSARITSQSVRTGGL